MIAKKVEMQKFSLFLRSNKIVCPADCVMNVRFAIPSTPRPSYRGNKLSFVVWVEPAKSTDRSLLAKNRHNNYDWFAIFEAMR
jgi:hypothetical protein